MSMVFGVGLSRTGTKSLAEGVDVLEFACIHFPRTLAEIDTHDAGG